MDKLKKADFNIEITDRMKKRTELLVQSLSADPQVQSLVRRNHLPEDLVQKKPWTIERWKKSISLCSGCSGLSACHQKLRGYVPDLTYDGVLQESFQPCRYKRQQDEKEKHLSQYEINDLPEKMKTIIFENIHAGEEAPAYLSVVSRLIEASRENKGIYLYGNMGVGKTYLAACAANEHARKGMTVCFVHYPSFVQRLTSSVKDGEYKDELESAMYCDFLVLDDIGAENVTEWNRDSILLPLLNSRYESRRPVWFTSNCDLDTLEMHLTFAHSREDSLKAKRIIERISHMAEVQALTGKDRRKFM